MAYTQKNVKSVYAMYARNFSTNYVLDSGNCNLIGRKHTTTLALGLNMDYPLKQQLLIRTGVAITAHFMGEITYGNTNGVPKDFYAPAVIQYWKGIEYIEIMTLGIPIKIAKQYTYNKNISIKAGFGCMVNTYFSTKNESIGDYAIRDDGTNNLWAHYTIQRNFSTQKVVKPIYISTPIIEWQIDLEAIHKLKKTGAIVVGLKAHIGTNKLEQSNFVVWPDFASHKSKGHYTINRSYLGIYAGYRFGKNKNK